MMTAPHDAPTSVQSELDAQRRWCEQVAARAAKYRILSTLPYTKVPFWVSATHTVNLRRGQGWASRRGIPEALFVLKLLRHANHHDIVLLTGGERRDLVYAAIAGLCWWIRTPHVIVDAHWQQGTGLKHTLQKWLLRLSGRLVKQVQPHSAEEVQIYHRIFQLPLSKLAPIPWSTSLIGFDDVSPTDVEEPFVLTGGLSFRDYGVFLAAAKQSGLRIKIGLPKAGVTQQIQALVDQCPNVSLHTAWSNADYVRQMQLCRVFAMPITQRLTRSTADQTLLNAMHYGKVVVSTDSIGPRIYIRDGENGYLVREATPQAWARTLKHAFDLSADAYARVERQAWYDARVVFNEPLRLARTLALALEVLSPRQPEDDRFHFSQQLSESPVPDVISGR